MVDSNRCSTAPLEHNFGIARINSNDNNRMDNLIKKFSYLDVRRIDKYNFTNIILPEYKSEVFKDNFAGI